MKKIVLMLCFILFSLLLSLFALEGYVSTETPINNQKIKTPQNDCSLGEYYLDIKGVRLAKDLDGKDVAIIKYCFTNISNTPATFNSAFEAYVYQNNVGLDRAYILEKSANFDPNPQNEQINSGDSLELEVAYILTDTTAELKLELKSIFPCEDNLMKKTLQIK